MNAPAVPVPLSPRLGGQGSWFQAEPRSLSPAGPSLADGASEPLRLLTPPQHTHQLGRAGGASRGVPGVDLLPGNGGMWTRAQQSEASHLLLKANARYGCNVFLATRHDFC